MIPLFKVFMAPEAGEELNKVLYSGYITQGKKVEEFEWDLQEWLGVRYLNTVNAGTNALQLALHLSGITPEKGGKVISTPMTCSATNTAIKAAGGDIVWADVDSMTGNISPNSVENKILDNPDAKVVMIVHWGGRPCDLEAFNFLANKYGVKIIEDAAHAFGAQYYGHKIGCHSDFVCFGGRTLITTERGQVPIKDIKVGDRVLTESGKFEKVLLVHKNLNPGKWTRIWTGKLTNETALSGTENHPIKIYRDGTDQWVPMKEVLVGDFVYVETIRCTECNNLIPHYHKYCKNCERTNQKYEMKKYFSDLAKSKTLSGQRYNSQSLHYYNDILPKAEQLIKENEYDLILSIGRVIPDIIAIKDNKAYAIEVENKATPRLSKELKYNEVKDYYESVIWVTRETRLTKRKQEYEIVGNLARVRVVRTQDFTNNSSACKYVYNLTVDNDSTYFARKTLVHNCFSFQAIKHLTTIDGGAVVSREQGDHERGKLLRWFGIDRNQPRGDFRCEADIVEAGYKYHMNDVNASVGLANLSYMRGIVRQHVENGEFYNKELTRMPEVRLPSQPSSVTPSYWIYTIHVPDRDAFMKYMTSKGIVTSQVHARNDLHTMFKKYRVDLPGVDAFTATQINIPVGWWVTEKDREYIVKNIREFYGRQNG